MEVILKKDIAGLGYRNDLVIVKDGYARNYLIPKKMVAIATPSEKKSLAEMKKQQAYKEEKVINEAETIADALKGAELKIGVKASSTGKIFGSVNNIMVANAILSQKKIEIDRKTVDINEEHIKEVGKYKATIHLHKNVAIDIDLDVVAE